MSILTCKALIPSKILVTIVTKHLIHCVKSITSKEKLCFHILGVAGRQWVLPDERVNIAVETKEKNQSGENRWERIL